MMAPTTAPHKIASRCTVSPNEQWDRAARDAYSILVHNLWIAINLDLYNFDFAFIFTVQLLHQGIN